MSNDSVNRNNKLAVLIIVIAAALLMPPLIARFRWLRGQGSNRNSEPQGESPNTVPDTYRGKHAINRCI